MFILLTAEREAFVSEALRKMLAGGFKGKQVVTCLPANVVAIQHLRMVKMNGEEFAKALPYEAAGKLPFDPNRARLRHTLSAEIYQNGEARQEVIVMAAPREAVDRHLSLLSRQKLEVVGIHVEPNAMVECFGHLFRRKGDENICTLFIDVGAGATHVVIAHGKTLVFAKHVPVGGDLLNRLVADALKVGVAQAKDMRIRASRQQAQAAKLPDGVVGIGADQNTHPLGRQNALGGAGIDAETVGKVNEATLAAVENLTGELRLCMRYYESIFPGRTVDRAIFVGGESRHIPMCQRIAKQLGVPATLGDPLARLIKDNADTGGVDVRQPQPGWAIAVGLALGLAPAAVEREAKSA